MILSNKRMTKALIRLRGCAGWSVPLLFANHRRQVFLRRGPYSICVLYALHRVFCTVHVIFVVFCQQPHQQEVYYGIVVKQNAVL